MALAIERNGGFIATCIRFSKYADDEILQAQKYAFFRVYFSCLEYGNMADFCLRMEKLLEQ